MLSDKKFILKIKEHKILYGNSTIKPNSEDELKQEELWNQIAHDFNLKDANSAQIKWQELVQDYITSLIHGNTTAFPHSNEMIFMQSYILGQLDSPEDSDLDMDEKELQRILYSDDECEVSPLSISSKCKRFKVQTTDKSEDKSTEKNTTRISSSSECVPSRVQSDTQSNTDSNFTSFNNLSSLELIFLGYAKVLQKMPLQLQLKTKRKIVEIMDEAEMMMLEQ